MADPQSDFDRHAEGRVLAENGREGVRFALLLMFLRRWFPAICGLALAAVVSAFVQGGVLPGLIVLTVMLAVVLGLARFAFGHYVILRKWWRE